MVEARQHEPKLAALAALHEGKLTPRGRARLQRHLDRCKVCRQALTGTGRYAALRSAEIERELPEVSWARVEQELLAEGRRLARAERMGKVGWPIALAAAAAIAFTLWPKHERVQAPAPAPAAVAARPQTPPPRELGVEIAAIVGDAVLVTASGERVPLALSTRPREGDAIETGAGGEVHLRLEDTASVLLAAESRLELSALRELQVELGLPRGRVVNAVQPLGSGRYAVAAGQHRVVVRGTHFAVDQSERGLAVQVDEGAVAVLRDEQVLAELKAPQRWVERPATEASPGATAALPRPRHAAAGSGAWPALEVPVWPRIERWALDGSEFPGTGLLRLRVPEGELEIRALLADGRWMHARITIDAIGARFDPRELKFDADPSAELGPGRGPDPAAAAAVLKAGQPGLQRCYERSLRNQPSGALRARLHLQLDGRGRVRQARLHSTQAVPDLLSECVRNVAGTWEFPAPGGTGVTLEAPIVFQPR